MEILKKMYSVQRTIFLNFETMIMRWFLAFRKSLKIFMKKKKKKPFDVLTSFIFGF